MQDPTIMLSGSNKRSVTKEVTLLLLSLSIYSKSKSVSGRKREKQYSLVSNDCDFNPCFMSPSLDLLYGLYQR